MLFSSALASAALISSVSALKIGLISDLHLNWRYDELIGGTCVASESDPTDIRAPMGRYGCDPPQVLIETMIQRMNDEYGEPDVVLITGDLNAHNTSMVVNAPLDENATYSLLLS